MYMREDGSDRNGKYFHVLVEMKFITRKICILYENEFEPLMKIIEAQLLIISKFGINIKDFKHCKNDLGCS